MFMKRIVFVFLMLLTVVYGFSQASLQPAATVNLIRSEAITVGQLRTEVERMERSAGRTMTQADRLQVLDVMINERLVLQAAERDRITATDNEVNQQIQQLQNNLAQQLGRPPTEAEFAQAVRNDSGLDVPAFRDEIRRLIIFQKYLVHRKGDMINSVRPPTEQEILNEYNLTRANFVRPETIRFSMIQIPFGPDAASRDRARTLANSLVRDINNDPIRFDEVAVRSAAPNSGFSAGDAGYVPRNQDARNFFGQDFMDVAFALRQGQVSRLIEGRLGFQIIKVTENHAFRQLELNDILQLGTRITVRDFISQQMAAQRQQLIVAQATQELVLELRTPRTFQINENNVRW
jgi:parvulin-like peptidyl-prolyl isomerase